MNVCLQNYQTICDAYFYLASHLLSLGEVVDV